MGSLPVRKERPNCECEDSVRFLLAAVLVLLFLWLCSAQAPDNTAAGASCRASLGKETAVSVLLSPLFLYSWLTSALVQLLLSAPALVLVALHQTLLFLLALPWAVLTLGLTLALTGVHVVVYLLHLALLGAVAVAVAAALAAAPGGDEMVAATHAPRHL